MLTPVKRDVPHDRPWHAGRMKAKVEHFTDDGKKAWGVRQT
jgi:hypothetical protein